jgi:ketosteroid isomerase-like protein
MSRVFLSLALLTPVTLSAPCRAQSSLDPFAHPPPSQLLTPGLSPGAAFLFDLEAKFARATAQGGGPAFASWFADDAVTLSNGKAPVAGHAAIAKQATWSPKNYQLTWTPTAGLLSGDMGYTWGHYQGTAINADGQRTTNTGRYLTIWKKQPSGEWKVELDASNDEPANAGECCKLP